MAMAGRSFAFGLFALAAAGIAVPATAQLGVSFGGGDDSGLSIGVGAGPYKPGQPKPRGGAPGVGKTTTWPKASPLAPHGPVVNQKATPHGGVGNGAPPTGAPQGKPSETVGPKDHTVGAGSSKDVSKSKSNAAPPSPSSSPNGPEKIESKKVAPPSPTPAETPKLGDKPKDETTKRADKPSDAPKTDESKTDEPKSDETPPVVIVPAPVPVVETPIASPPPAGGATPPTQPNPRETGKTALAPPPFQEIPEINDCDECQELWESILHYEQIIEEDTQRLAERQKQVQDLVAERDKLQADLVKATTAADRTYDQQMIKIDDDSIQVRNQ